MTKIKEKTKLQYNQLGDTPYSVSEVGFGTYRVSSDSEDHQVALAESIKAGINLIDTSSNYGDGDAEKLVGSTLNTLISSQLIQRDDIVVVSKGGYIQGQTYIESQKRKENNTPIPECVEYSKGLEHCIHPDFIAEQITKSLNRLDLDHIDIYLLHNPEYYLMSQKLNDIPVEDAKKEFYRRIKAAFQHLESEVRYGRIKYYGISSNTLPNLIKSNPTEDYDRVDINELVEIAKEISKTNHFKVVQFPLNLLENNATILPIAKEHNLGVLINRPLNAIFNESLHRLVDFHVDDTPSSLEIEDLIQDLVQFESTVTDLNFEDMGCDKAHSDELKKSISWGQQLSHHWNNFLGYEHWKDTLSAYFLPHIDHTLGVLADKNRLKSEDEEWFNQYLQLFNTTIQHLSAHYKSISANRSEHIKTILNRHIPDWCDCHTLSQKAIHGLRELDGVSSILVGMRKEEYLNDILIEIQTPRPQKTDQNWNKLKEVIREISKL